MAMIIVVLFGAGLLLLISAIENKPILGTFQQIMRGEKLDLTGQNQKKQ